MSTKRITSKNQAGDDILNLFKKDSEEQKKIETDKRVRVGIIGTGWIAAAHLASYKRMLDVDIIAGADIIEGKADAFFKEHNLKNVHTYTDHKEMLEKEQLDCVSVCTYNSAHAVCTIDALNAGINVLLEKPMCVTLDEAVAICRAEKKGKVLTIGFQPRFDPNMQKIREIVQSGELGQVYYIQTGGGRRREYLFHLAQVSLRRQPELVRLVTSVVIVLIWFSMPLVIQTINRIWFLWRIFGNKPEYYRRHPEYADKFGVDDFACAFIRLEGGYFGFSHCMGNEYGYFRRYSNLWY